MATRARNLANLLGSGEDNIPASKLSNEISTIEQASSTDVLTNLGNAVGDQRLVGNNLYIWNGSGWYRIALINQTPTWDSGGQPFASYILDADSPQDATVITLAASDPDGLPIQYSYVTGGSMDSMATISQDSSVFTITPKTVSEVGEGAELTGSITFRASDGVNILPHVSSFTLNFISVIENSKYTTLLVTATGTSDNNNITDSSTNNHTITVTGDAHAGSFSPYRHGGYSYEVTATGNYIAIDSGYLTTNTTWWKSSGFTIEGWVYFTNLSNSAIIDTRVSPSSGFLINMGAQIANKLSIYSNSAWRGNFVDTTFATGEWYYIVLQVSGTSANLYVNGILDSTTVTVPDSSTHNYFGQNIHTLGGVQYTPRGANSLDGFYYDWKFTAGTVYSSNFTPPTESLESDANTALYIKSDTALLRDASSNGSVVTSVGGKTSPFTPYDNFSYSADAHGGSIYFDGNSYLTTPYNSSFVPSGDFTIETWYYGSTITGAYNRLLTSADDNGGANWGLSIKTTGEIYFYTGENTTLHETTATVKFNSWNHIAVSRSGSNLRIFVNGIGQTFTNSVSLNNNLTLALGIGADSVGNNKIVAYLSDIRMVSGTALYTSDFTPPTAPQSSSGTVLHLKGTDASIIDKSQSSNLKLVGNTTGSTTEVKFAGSKSIYFDGSGDYAEAPASDNWAFGNGPWTIEFWINSTDTDFDPVSAFNPSSPFAGWGIRIQSGLVKFWVSDGSSSDGHDTVSGTTTVNDGTWHHVALTSASGSNAVSCYIDGTLAGSHTFTVAISTSGQALRVGADTNATIARPLNGYMQDVRITKGLARYTTNFTPPAQPLKG